MILGYGSLRLVTNTSRSAYCWSLQGVTSIISTADISCQYSRSELLESIRLMITHTSFDYGCGAYGWWLRLSADCRIAVSLPHSRPCNVTLVVASWHSRGGFDVSRVLHTFIWPIIGVIMEVVFRAFIGVLSGPEWPAPVNQSGPLLERHWA